MRRRAKAALICLIKLYRAPCGLHIRLGVAYFPARISYQKRSAGETMVTKIGHDAIFRKKAELLESDVDDEIVALDMDKGQCYGLNAVGSRVWRLLDEPRSVHEICSTLQGEYEVEPEECREEVSRLLADLQSEGLIEIQS
jgi:hypothetical protein